MTIDPAVGPGPSALTGSPVFEIIDATVAFDGFTVLDEINLKIEAGSFVALLGANGSGKTTLVRAMLGLQPLASGQVLVHGTTLARFRQWHRIAFVPQRLPAATGVPISALELVTTSSVSPRTRWHRNRTAARAISLDALEAVGLADRRHSRIDVLSGGQQRRVMIARALAQGADTLVLDEPMSGVDLANQASLADVLASLHGRTIVMVAHGLGTVTDLVTRAVILDSGHVVHDGATAPQDWAHLHHHSDEPDRPALLEG